MVWLLWVLMLHIPPVSLSLSGPNTTGTLSLLAANVVYLAGGDNITISQNQYSLTIVGGTNFQSPGAYLTTAALSQDSSKYAGTNGAITGGSITVNTSGVSVNLPAYLTTAALSADSSKYAGTNGAITGGSITVNTSGVSVNLPAYLTTADLSANSSNYLRNWKLTGGTAGTTSSAQGTDFWLAGGNGVTISGSSNTLSFSVNTNYQSQAAYLTTAALSADSSKYAGTNGAITGGSITVNTSGVSVNLPAYLTTAALSGDTTKYVQNWKLTGNLAGTTSSAQGTDLWLAGGNGVTISGSSNTLSFSVATNYQAQGAYLTTARASTDAVGLNTALTANGVAWTVNSSGLSLNVPAFLTTAMLSNRGSDFVQAAAAFAGTNASGTIASGGISVSVAAAGGNTLSFYEPLDYLGMASTTSTGGFGTLHLQPFMPEAALSFAQLNVIASDGIVSTTAANTFSVSCAGASSFLFQATFTNTNSQFIDVYLFSKGTGGFTSNLQTYASTRNSVVTFQTHTIQLSASGTGGPSGSGSWSLKSSVSVNISYPGLTSGTVTSVNNNSTVTTWGTGYTVWTGSISTSKSSTFSTNSTNLASCPGTWPATTEWLSNKLVPLMFGTSVAAGENWIGFNLSSSTSSSSSSANTGVGANHSYTSSINASQLTVSQQFTYVGATNSLASSLGYMGAGVQATMAPSPGHGSFSATYSPASTYVNNAGQPNGAIAFSQINSNASFFKTWVQFANYRI